MNNEPHTYLATVAGVALYEHGQFGDESPMMAKVKGRWFATDFWDMPSAEEVLEWKESIG